MARSPICWISSSSVSPVTVRMVFSKPTKLFHSPGTTKSSARRALTVMLSLGSVSTNSKTVLLTKHSLCWNENQRYDFWESAKLDSFIGTDFVLRGLDWSRVRIVTEEIVI